MNAFLNPDGMQFDTCRGGGLYIGAALQKQTCTLSVTKPSGKNQRREFILKVSESMPSVQPHANRKGQTGKVFSRLHLGKHIPRPYIHKSHAFTHGQIGWRT